jgi:hypothetical protein
VRVERQGVRAGPDEGRHHHIDGNIEAMDGKLDDTALWYHIGPTIHDELSRVRIKELHIEVHKGAVV